MTRTNLSLAVALLLPTAANAAPICAVLKAVRPIAEKDKFMASLKAGPADADGEYPGLLQVNGFKCVVTTGSTPGVTRGFYNCTWQKVGGTPPVLATLDAIGKCFDTVGVEERKSYTTTTSFELRKTPHMWIAANQFSGGDFSFSLIAE